MGSCAVRGRGTLALSYRPSRRLVAFQEGIVAWICTSSVTPSLVSATRSAGLATPNGPSRRRVFAASPQAANGLVSLVPEVDIVLASPYRRAWQTALILEEAGWPEPLRAR